MLPCFSYIQFAFYFASLAALHSCRPFCRPPAPNPASHARGGAMEAEGAMEDSYYVAVREATLAVALLLGLHCCALLYLRWSLGMEKDDSRDGLPLQLCALSRGIAWAHAPPSPHPATPA